MKKVIISLVFVFLCSVLYADEIVFVENGKFQVITLENYNGFTMPKQIKQYTHADDSGLTCMNESTNEQFFIIIRGKKGMTDFDKGLDFGYKHVKMKVRLVTIYNKMKIYEFVSWGN